MSKDMNKNIKKLWILNFCALISIATSFNIHSKAEKKICPLIISCIKNRSNTLVKLQANNQENKQENQNIDTSKTTTSNKNCVFEVKPKICFNNKNNTLTIPYISINSYIKEYVQDIHYIPKNVLKIYINNKPYALWQNEQGIVYSPIKTKTNKTQTCCLLQSSCIKDKNKSKAFNLLLEINKKGKINIKPLYNLKQS